MGDETHADIGGRTQMQDLEMNRSSFKTYAGGLVRYDVERRRVWVAGQRFHHGLTGALLTSLGVAGLAAHRLTPRGGVEWALLGTALMAHDWNDRTVWFRVGSQE
jgi:hypothetical protein